MVGAPPDATTHRLRGRILVLLALRNELRERHAPAWRRERNRIEIDRAVAELAAQSRDEPVAIAFRSAP